MATEDKARFIGVNCKRLRKILAKLRGGTTFIRIEIARRSGLKREERSCGQCTVEEVEDEKHFLLRCEGWRQEKEMAAERMEEMASEFVSATDHRKVVLIQST